MFNKNKDDSKNCPLLKKECIKHQCAWYFQVRGTHPQTGEPIDQWDCSLIMLPMLLIENSQQQRQTGAAVESFRNEMVKSNENSLRLLAQTQLNLIEGESDK